MKTRVKNIFVALFMVFALAVSSTPAWADESDTPVVPVAGAPQILLVNGPVFNARAGADNEIVLRLRDNSSFGAHSLVIQTTISDPAQSPFQIAFPNNANKISQLNARQEINVTMKLTVDETAGSQSYPITLNYTYYNQDGEKYTGSDTMYIKIENRDATPNFVVESLATDPGSLSAGGNAVFSGVIRNVGPQDMYEVTVSLEGLAPDGISVSGVNSQTMPSIGAGTRQNFGFRIVAASGLSAGNYPITVKLTYKNAAGTSHDFSQTYYVSVGGAGGSAVLELQNMKEPVGTYGANENFQVSFDLANTGKSTITNIKVTAVASNNDGMVVPKSKTIRTVDSLAAGETKTLQFTFAPTAAAASQNYPIAFTVEYNNGQSFTQYAGVNVEGKENGNGTAVSKPKLIVSDYSSDPLIVMAGEEFNLSITVLNTHPQKAVKNIKMFLTMQQETSTTDTKTGNIFTPVGSSNTFYFDSIGAKQKAQKTLRLYTLPDAQPKTYTLTVNFEYEDAAGNEYTATELLGINVKQPTQISVGDIYVPETTEAGVPIYVSFELYNTGKVEVSNLMVKIDGDVTAAAKETYLGNFNSGDTQYYDSSFTAFDVGTSTVNIIVSYDDPSGEHIEVPHEYTMTVTEPVPMDDSMSGMPVEPESTGPSVKTIVLILVIVAAAIVVLVVVLKKRKAKAEARMLEADDQNEAAEERDKNERS